MKDQIQFTLYLRSNPIQPSSSSGGFREAFDEDGTPALGMEGSVNSSASLKRDYEGVLS